MSRRAPRNLLLSLALVVVQFACLGFLLLSGPLWAAGALALFQLAGLGLGAWAIAVMPLGNFLVIPDVKNDARLVTRGPYQLLRHPMYTSLLMVGLAMVLNESSWPRLVAWGVLVVDLLLKLRYEESLLRQHFPEYEAYMKRSWRLLPFLF